MICLGTANKNPVGAKARSKLRKDRLLSKSLSLGAELHALCYRTVRPCHGPAPPNSKGLFTFCPASESNRHPTSLRCPHSRNALRNCELSLVASSTDINFLPLHLHSNGRLIILFYFRETANSRLFSTAIISCFSAHTELSTKWHAVPRAWQAPKR